MGRERARGTGHDRRGWCREGRGRARLGSLRVGDCRYRRAVTASAPSNVPPGGSLARGATPAAIRAALLPGDRDRFDQDYWHALEQAKQDYDVTGLHSTLENWRRQAIAQSDPESFRTMVRRAAAFFSGQPVPDDEPFEITRSKAGM